MSEIIQAIREHPTLKPQIQAIVANNKVSNVRPGPGLGVSCAHTVAAAAKRALELEGDVIPASTGVIGWALPVDEMVSAAFFAAMSTSLIRQITVASTACSGQRASET